jgi:glycosyltransferase involved in cell wall biosynthesis
MHKLSVVVPVYNEEKAIGDFISNLKGAMEARNIVYECVVVDDHSNDGSPEILKKTDVTLVTHNARLGYGAALKTGIDKASGDILCIIDADNQYEPSDILRLVQCIDSYDMVVGARVDAARNFPFYQRFAKGLVCFSLGLLFKQKIADINSGLRLMRKSIVKKYLSILPDAFSFTSSITLAMLLDNYRIKYVPIAYSKRVGKSKIKVFNYTINFVKSYWRIIHHSKFTSHR